MIYILNFLMMIFLSFLSLSFLPNLKIFGVAPILPIFFLVALSNFRKGFEPILLAAFFGIIFDIYSSYPFGMYLVIFLLISGAVRYMYQEGMKTLSFQSFSIISFIALVGTITTQILFIYFDKVIIDKSLIIPALSFLLVNMIYAILIYVFSIWYFEKIVSLEDKLKRR